MPALHPNVYARQYAKKHPDKYKQYRLKGRYGISLEIYQRMEVEQHGRCKICRRKETLIDGRTGRVRKLTVDHNHQTGRIRGLLCSQCNRSVGGFRDSISILQSAINYLRDCSRIVQG